MDSEYNRALHHHVCGLIQSEGLNQKERLPPLRGGEEWVFQAAGLSSGLWHLTPYRLTGPTPYINSLMPGLLQYYYSKRILSQQMAIVEDRLS